MTRMTTKKFINFFITWDEGTVDRYGWPTKTWEVTTPELEFGLVKITANKANDRLDFLFYYDNVVEATASVHPTTYDRSGCNYNIIVQLSQGFGERMMIPMGQVHNQRKLFQAVADYFYNITRVQKKTLKQQYKTLNSRLSKPYWDFLTWELYNSLIPNYEDPTEFINDLASIKHMEFDAYCSEYLTKFNNSYYPNAYCAFYRVGFNTIERIRIPSWFARANHTHAQARMYNGLYNWRGYLLRPETCVQLGEEWVPREYYAQQTRTCSECGTSFTTTNNSTHFGTICGSCLGVDPSKLTIHNYSTRAEQILKFKLGKKTRPKLLLNDVYFGLELEYESDDPQRSVLETVRVLDEHAILKRDGSIHNGFEIVTCPATRDIHSDIFKTFFEKFENKTLKLKAEANCGFHVHISKNPLTFLSIGKINAFMNNPHNFEYISLIAGRKSNYAQQDPTRNHVCFPWNNKDRLTNTNRYNMLNLQNRHTLEFRIFAPPKTYGEFQKDLDFVEAMVDYNLPCGHKVALKEHSKHEHFTSFVLANHKSYPYLADFLKGN